MPKMQRYSVPGYAGVFYIEANRAAKKGVEKIYYIRYRKNGKLIEEKVGRQFKDNMTPAKASSIRGLRIEGCNPTNQGNRDRIKEEKLKEISSYSFIRLFSLFEESKHENRSLKDDRTRFALHVAPFIGRKVISALTTQDIEKIRRKMEKDGKSPQTVKHVLTLIKRLVNFALKNGYIAFIPGTLHFDMPVVDNKVTENLTSEQMAKLLQVLDEEEDKIFASLIRLALFTGMRRGALINLQWTDLDFERNIITLRGDVAKKKKTEYIPMNEKAKELGMVHTSFKNCNGLDDSIQSGHYSSAYDVALMSKELITKYPEISNYSTVWMDEITHTTRKGTSQFGLTNTNKLIRTYNGITGLKTGSTSKAKYCLSATAERNGVSLTAVIMAAPDPKERFAEAAALLDYGFSNCTNYSEKASKIRIKPQKIINGIKDQINSEVARDFSYTLCGNESSDKIEKKIMFLPDIKAPVKKGDEIGSVVYILNGKEIDKIPIKASEDIKEAGYITYFQRLLKRLLMAQSS